MVSSDSVHLLNFIAESRGLVNEQLEEIMWGRFPREKFKLFLDGMCPRNNDSRGDLNDKKDAYTHISSQGP